MFAAAESIRELQARIIRVLRDSSITFALSGSNATFAWIADIDEAAVRQYRNIELIIDRRDGEHVTERLSQLNLLPDKAPFQIYFRERYTQRKRWAHRALFAGEQVAGGQCCVPSLSNVIWLRNAPIIGLKQLVTFQLSRWYLDDQVDLRDLIEVGLVEATWLTWLPAALASRLKELLDNPDG
jgi:hypothetical protein